MARKKIREYNSKQLLKAHIKRLAGLDLPIQVAQVRGGWLSMPRVDSGCHGGQACCNQMLLLTR